MGNNLDTQQTPAPTTEPTQNMQTPQANPEPQVSPEPKDTPDENQPSIADLMKQIAEIKVDNRKLKKANDNLASENASLKKQVNAKLTEEELRAQQKSDEFEEIKKELAEQRRENQLNKSTKSYMSMGMNEELAMKVAQAHLDGDDELVNSSIKSFMEAQNKAVEEKVKADLLAKMPAPISGNGDGQIDYEKQYNEMLAAGDVTGAIMASLNAGAQQQAAQ